MSTAPTGWTAPKTDWASDDAVDEDDLNRVEINTGAIELGDRTVDDTQVPSSDTGTLREFLDWFANMIKQITGNDDWYDAPAKPLSRIHVSGSVGGDATQAVGAATAMVFQTLTIAIPAHSSLVVRRAMYKLDGGSLRLYVRADDTWDPGDGVSIADGWGSADNGNDVSPSSSNEVYNNASTGPVDKQILIIIYNDLVVGATINQMDGWAVELDYQAYAGTTTTTTASP